MNKLLILVAFASFLGAVLTEEVFCGDPIPISYKLFDHRHSIEPEHKPTINVLKDRILHHYCDNLGIVNFNKPTQNLTVILYPTREHSLPAHFFNDDRYGERYLMTNPAIPNDKGVNISLVPEVLNLSHEDALRYQMYSGVFNRRGQLKNFEDINDKRTYIDGVVEGIPKDNEPIRFTPGWVTKLKGKKIISQTLLPGPNSTLKEGQVFVVRYWLNVTETEGFHSTIKREQNDEDVTVFYKSPDLESAKFDLGFVNVGVKHFGANGQAFYEEARLEPGWYGELDHVTKQTLTYNNPQKVAIHPQVRNVTVYPGGITVRPENGATIHQDFSFGTAVLTIYYSDNPEANVDNRREMYKKVHIVPQASQSLNEGFVKLSPGWIGVLDRSLKQTLLTVEHSKIFRKEQEVVVTPGWEKFHDLKGFTALVSTSGDGFEETEYYPISVHFLSQK